MIEQLAFKVNVNPALVRRGRRLSTVFLIEIGERAHTAAGSVVTHDVPAEGAVRGVPARSDDEAKRGNEKA